MSLQIICKAAGQCVKLLKRIMLVQLQICCRLALGPYHLLFPSCSCTRVQWCNNEPEIVNYITTSSFSPPNLRVYMHSVLAHPVPSLQLVWQCHTHQYRKHFWLVSPDSGTGSWQLSSWMLYTRLSPPDFMEERAWDQGYTVCIIILRSEWVKMFLLNYLTELKRRSWSAARPLIPPNSERCALCSQLMILLA